MAYASTQDLLNAYNSNSDATVQPIIDTLQKNFKQYQPNDNWDMNLNSARTMFYNALTGKQSNSSDLANIPWIKATIGELTGNPVPFNQGGVQYSATPNPTPGGNMPSATPPAAPGTPGATPNPTSPTGGGNTYGQTLTLPTGQRIAFGDPSYDTYASQLGLSKPLPDNPRTINASDIYAGLNKPVASTPTTVTPTNAANTPNVPSATTPPGGVPVGMAMTGGPDYSAGGNSGAVDLSGGGGQPSSFSTTAPLTPSQYDSARLALGAYPGNFSQFFSKDSSGNIFLNPAGAVKLASLGKGTGMSINTGTGVNLPASGVGGQTIVLPDGQKFTIPDLTDTYQKVLAGLNTDYTAKLQTYQDTYLKPIYDDLKTNEDQINTALDGIVSRKGIDRGMASTFFMTAASLAGVTAADTQPLRDLVEVLDAKRNLALDTLKTRQDALGQYASGLQYENSLKTEALTLAIQSQQNVFAQLQAYASAYGSMIQNQKPVQTGQVYDPNTGQYVPVYSTWNPQTKNWETYNGSAGGGSSSSSSGVSGIVGSAAAGYYDMGNYAVNNDGTPNQQALANVQQILDQMGQFKTPADITSYIQKVAPGSPITADMVQEASQKFGVPWEGIVATMQAETQLGTDGSKGAQGFNFGNVGNTNTAMAAGRPVVMSTPQAGVDAVARNLAGRFKGMSVPGGIASGASGAQRNPNGTPTYQQAVAAAPLLVKNAIKVLPDGTPYIDKGDLEANAMAPADIFASKYGIRALNKEDANMIDDVKRSLANLNVVTDKFAGLASTSAFSSKIIKNITDPISQFFDTNHGSLLKAYNSNRDGLFQQINALAGSHPRINTNELNIAANALPRLTEFNKDTLKDGLNKLNLTQRYLDNAIRTVIPSYVGSPLEFQGKFSVQDNSGKNWFFADQSSALNFLSQINAK